MKPPVRASRAKAKSDPYALLTDGRVTKPNPKPKGTTTSGTKSHMMGVFIASNANGTSQDPVQVGPAPLVPEETTTAPTKRPSRTKVEPGRYRDLAAGRVSAGKKRKVDDTLDNSEQLRPEQAREKKAKRKTKETSAETGDSPASSFRTIVKNLATVNAPIIQRIKAKQIHDKKGKRRTAKNAAFQPLPAIAEDTAATSYENVAESSGAQVLQPQMSGEKPKNAATKRKVDDPIDGEVPPLGAPEGKKRKRNIKVAGTEPSDIPACGSSFRNAAESRTKTTGPLIQVLKSSRQKQENVKKRAAKTNQTIDGPSSGGIAIVIHPRTTDISSSANKAKAATAVKASVAQPTRTERPKRINKGKQPAYQPGWDEHAVTDAALLQELPSLAVLNKPPPKDDGYMPMYHRDGMDTYKDHRVCEDPYRTNGLFTSHPGSLVSFDGIDPKKRKPAKKIIPKFITAGVSSDALFPQHVQGPIDDHLSVVPEEEGEVEKATGTDVATMGPRKSGRRKKVKTRM
jgi:hypothetical protein